MTHNTDTDDSSTDDELPGAFGAAVERAPDRHVMTRERAE
jgi:hypothetical protein